MNFNYDKFIENLKDKFKSANGLIGNYYEAMLEENSASSTKDENIYKEKTIYFETLFDNVIAEIKLKLQFAFEKFEMPILLKQFLSDWNKSKDFVKFTPFPFTGDVVSPVLLELEKYFNLFLDEVVIDDTDCKKKILERILRGTPTIIENSGIKPNSENQVQKKVYDVLQVVFDDIVREFSIPGILKGNKPDFGITSLKTAIEYKYVGNTKDCKIFSGGIFEDYKAYSNSEDWKFFYAVIYLTGSYYTDDQVKREFKQKGIPDNWKIILVHGSGNRTNKKINKK